VYKLFGELVFIATLVGGIVFVPVSTGVADTQSVTKEAADIMDRWLGRAAEYGIIGIVALWLLRVIIVDVKGDIKLVTQLLMKIAEQSETGGNEIKRLSNEINTKMDRLLRDVERIEYKRQREDDK
jgi:hypothetical protein